MTVPFVFLISGVIAYLVIGAYLGIIAISVANDDLEGYFEEEFPEIHGELKEHRSKYMAKLISSKFIVLLIYVLAWPYMIYSDDRG